MDHYHHSPKHLPDYDSFAAPAYLPMPTRRREKYNLDDHDPTLKVMKERYNSLIDELDSIEDRINVYESDSPSYARFH